MMFSLRSRRGSVTVCCDAQFEVLRFEIMKTDRIMILILLPLLLPLQLLLLLFIYYSWIANWV